MRTTTLSFAADLTTRARLRNSAIELFATRGFDASVREIAAHAGVSAGLITHHFGSKESLRLECDAEVLRQYSVMKGDGIALSPTQTITMMTELDDHATMAVYILRSVREGGAAGVEFLSSMIEETLTVMEEGVAAGVIRPSRDPRARAKYLVTSSLGGLLLQLTLKPALDLADMRSTMRELIGDITLPALELYTEGVLTDRSTLDEYLPFLSDPPVGQEAGTRTSVPPSEKTA